MRYKLKTAPTEYPVTLAEVKTHLRLDSVSFADDLTTTQCLAPAARAANTYTGTAVDVLGYSALVNFNAGDCSAGTVTVTVQDSADNVTYSTWEAFTAVNSANDIAVYEKEYTGGERYIRVSVVVATGACSFGVDIVKDKYVDAEDTYLTSLITAATDVTEKYLGRKLITQTWECYLDDWPIDPFKLDFPPLQDINSVKYYDTSSTEATFTDYYEDIKSEPGRIGLTYGYSWPSTTLRPINGIIIDFDCGYGAAASVPELIKVGILDMIAHMYEHREIVVVGTIVANLPFTFKNLLDSYRVIDA